MTRWLALAVQTCSGPSKFEASGRRLRGAVDSSHPCRGTSKRVGGPLPSARAPSMANEEPEGAASDQLSLGEAPKFLCGVAVSVYQNSGAASPPMCRHLRERMLAHRARSSPMPCAGDPNSQWKAFEEQKAAHVNVNLRLSAGVLPEWDTPSASGDGVVAATWENLGPSKIVGDQRIGVASDFWNRYAQDIQLAKDIRACPRLLLANHPFLPMLLHAEVAWLVRRLQQLPAVHRVEPPVPAPGRAQPGRRGALQRDL